MGKVDLIVYLCKINVYEVNNFELIVGMGLTVQFRLIIDSTSARINKNMSYKSNLKHM
jgi:hypothetical protein